MLDIDLKKYMREALKEAEKAFTKGEVPVGAIIVNRKDSSIISRAHNRIEELTDPTAHAELLAIREASNILNRWRLSEEILFVTLEPCPMCAGAIIRARLPYIVYGADDPKAGAAGSVVNIVNSKDFNHRTTIINGVLKQDCSEILGRFFQKLR